MALKLIDDESLVAVANAINEKTGASGALQFPDGFINAILSISGGGNEDLNDVLTEQENLISELRAVLEQKASNYVDPAELSVFDPTKETILKRETASYKSIFLEKTTIGYINTGKYAGYLGCKFDAVVGHEYKLTYSKISSSGEHVFIYQSDTILDKVDGYYGLELNTEDIPYVFTAEKPYVYIWAAHDSAPSNTLVLVTGLMVHDITGGDIL